MYFATYLIDIFALLVLIWLLYSSTSLNVYRKKPFLIGVLLTIIIILAEAGSLYVADGSLNLRNAHIFFNILGFSLTPLIPIVIAFIIDKKILISNKFIIIPSIINAVITLLSPIFKFIFYVDANNQYLRGDYFYIFITVYVINFLFLVVSTINVGKKFNYPITQKLVVLSLFTLIGTSIQLIYPQAYSSWHSVTLSLFLYFLLISEFDSSFDTLTGLYNRTAFDKKVKEISNPKDFFIIILDIDNFKNFNDTLGHSYGDKVIETVASVIRESFAKHYTCYRFGGDEFSIIGYEKDENKIEYQLKTMTDSLEEMRKQNPLPTISYGYSFYKEDEVLDFENIFNEADQQMYHFKKIHKNDGVSTDSTLRATFK